MKNTKKSQSLLYKYSKTSLMGIVFKKMFFGAYVKLRDIYSGGSP